MTRAGKQKIDPNQFAVSSLNTVATVLLAIAGFSGLSHPVLTLWTVCLASVIYVAAFWVSQHNTLSHKNRLAAGLIAACVLAAIAIQIRLGESAPPKASVPVQATTPVQVPSTIVNRSTGDATAVGLGNSAISGDGNTVLQQHEPTHLSRKSQGRR